MLRGDGWFHLNSRLHLQSWRCRAALFGGLVCAVFVFSLFALCVCFFVSICGNLWFAFLFFSIVVCFPFLDCFLLCFLYSLFGSVLEVG